MNIPNDLHFVNNTDAGENDSLSCGGRVEVENLNPALKRNSHTDERLLCASCVDALPQLVSLATIVEDEKGMAYLSFQLNYL